MLVPLISALLLVSLQEGGAGTETTRFEELSLEQLMQLTVTSVSRGEQSVNESAAAVHVITQEEIRRSGLTTIPELLRLAPGVHVARINSSAWAIGIRGFNGRFTDKLLVMIDGRPVYNNLFSGVWWDSQDVLVEDIDRIEVIRGPGASVWGANAVNGVVNVITKSAAETHGTYASVLAGNEDRTIAGVRQGGELPGGGHWRAYTRWRDHDGSEAPSSLGGGDLGEPWSQVQAGVRLDWLRAADTFTVQGDYYRGRIHEFMPFVSPTAPFSVVFQGVTETFGANVLGRWSRTLSDDSDLSLQVFVDAAERESSIADNERITYDVDFQHRFGLGGSHSVTWGLGYRLIDSMFEGGPLIATVPEERADSYFSGFLQDAIGLGDEWTLLLGTKLEHNEFTGFEIQPTIRASWAPESGDRSVWASISRAVRIPSVVDDDLVLPIEVIPGMPNTVVTVFGDEDFESEDVIAYELGGRLRAGRVYLDLAAYYNDYDRIGTLEPGAPFFDGTNQIAPVFFDNKADAWSIGVEVAVHVDVTERWRLQGWFALEQLEVELDADSMDADPVTPEDTFPRYQAQLSSYYHLTDDLTFDVAAYAVDDLEGVPSYLRLDTRIAWIPRDDLELSLVVQNAADPSHQEFTSDLLSTASRTERSFYVGLRWRP